METLRFIVQVFLAITGIVILVIGMIFTPRIVYKLRQLDLSERPEIAWDILLGCVIVEFINFMILLVFTGGYVLDRVAEDQKRYPDPIAISEYELKSYSFDPETVLAAIRQSDNDIFQPLPEDAYYDTEAVYNPGSFPWQQQDFLTVSRALYQSATNNTLEGWRVHGWWFDRDCAGSLTGFDAARIAYFNPDKGQNPTFGEHTVVDIDLKRKIVTWGENQDFESDSLFGWQSFDPTQLKITADDALRIADAHGGKEIRQSLENQYCSIGVYLYTDSNLWKVNYFGSAFEVTVDPYSGQYKIITR